MAQCPPPQKKNTLALNKVADWHAGKRRDHV